MESLRNTEEAMENTIKDEAFTQMAGGLETPTRANTRNEGSGAIQGEKRDQYGKKVLGSEVESKAFIVL